MTPNRSRRGRVAPVAVVAAVCLAGVAGSFGQSSASPAASGAAVGAALHATGRATAGSTVGSTAAAARHRGKRLPDTKSITSGVVGLSTAARDGRSKIDLQVPSVVAVAYLDPKYRTPASQLTRVPKYYLPAHPKAGCTYDQAIIYSDLYAVHIRQPNPKKQGVVTSVGRFPASHVSALGFGSVPVTATLHTRQTKRHGHFVPITANTVSGFTSVPTRSNGDSCDPSWDSGPQTPPLTTVSHATLSVRISDIRVDKQLLDVGRHCHTVTPLRLNLYGSKGYILYTGGRLIERHNGATEQAGASTYPLHPGSTNLTIPAFTGCVNPANGEDLSRLITAMVSGDRNTIEVHQSTAVLNGISNKHVTKCLKGQGCVKLPTFLKPPKPGMTGHRRHHR